MIDKIELERKVNSLSQEELKELALKMLITKEKTRLRVQRARDRQKEKEKEKLKNAE